MPTAKASRLRKAGIGFVVVAALLLALELLSRWLLPIDAGEDPLQTDYPATWYEKREADFHLFWRMKQRRRIVSSIGTRGPEVRMPKPDQFRILSLRESSTFAGRLALLDESFRKVRVPRKDRRRLLDRVVALCDEHGVKLAVVVPWYRSFDEHASLLRRFCKETEVPVVDLPVRLAAHADRRDELFLDRFHPTAEGHALIAAEIELVLREAWL